MMRKPARLSGLLLACLCTVCLAQSPYSARSGRTSGKLQIATFNLAKLSPAPENLEQTRAAASNIVTVVKTVLYAQGGESAASQQGRRYWYDSNTLQLTITDYPDNIRVVSDYIRSVNAPTTSRRSRSVVVPLRHQTSSELQGTLNQAMGLGASTTGAAATAGQTVTKTLSVGGELTFRDLRIRVLRVEQGSNPQLRGDGMVNMTVATATQQAQDRSIQSYHSEFIDDYEVNVLDVRPSGNGQGSARIEVRYNPAATGTAAVAVPGAQPGR